MSALHAATDLPALAPRMHVLAFGATTWADLVLSERFSACFDERTINLVTTKGLDGADECLMKSRHAAGWVVRPGTEDTPVLLDPMACGFSSELSPTGNVSAHPIAEGPSLT